MIYLNSVKFEKEYRCFKEGEKYEFSSPVVCLVGDQGCGKSTLINLLFNKEGEKKKIITMDVQNKVNCYSFDFEKDNPRIKGTLPNDVNKFHLVMNSFGKSHGEVLKTYSIEAIEQAKECVIFFDEPETALSLKNQYKLIKKMNEAVERNCQLIISTHCLPIIESQVEVLSLEHKKWMKSEEFINDQKINKMG